MIPGQVVNSVHLWGPVAERRPPVPEDAPRGTEPGRHTLTSCAWSLQKCVRWCFLQYFLDYMAWHSVLPASAHMGAKKFVKELL